MNQQETSNSSNLIHIFLVRGLTRESGHWGEFDSFLEQIIPGVKIHFLDLPGAGKFVKYQAHSKMNRMVDFMRSESQELMDNKAGTKIILATSLAGMTGVDWVTRYPNDFNGLIIVGSGFGGICSAFERVNRKVIGKMFRILVSTNVAKREKLIIEVNSNRPETHHRVLKDWIKIQSQRKMSNMNIYRQTIAGMRFRAVRKKLTIPLLIVGSESDRMVSMSCIEKTHETFGGTLIWHQTSGHGIALDEPEWLAQTAADWIKTTF